MDNHKNELNAQSLSRKFQASTVLALLVVSLTACNVEDARQDSPAESVTNNTRLACTDIPTMHMTGVTITRSEASRRVRARPLPGAGHH